MPAMTADESKALRVVDRETQALLDAAQRQMPDSVMKRRIRRRIAERHDNLVAELRPLMEGVVAGRIEPLNAASSAYALMLPAFTEAYRTGMVVAGIREWRLREDQVDHLAGYVEAEVKFFLRFMRSIAPESNDGNDRRLNLYGGAVDGAFWHGWLESLPSNVSLEWALGIAEHCKNCLELAANSPYGKPGTPVNPLPTVPRAGDTVCLSNCRCNIIATSGSFHSTPENLIGVEVTKIGALPVDPMSPGALAAAQLYQELVEQYAFFLRLSRLDPSGPGGVAARNARQAIAALAKQAGHTVRLRASDQEILAPVVLALGLYDYVPAEKVDDDLVTLVASILAINEVDRGRITRVDKHPTRVTLDGDRDRSYRLDAVGRALLFIERTP